MQTTRLLTLSVLMALARTGSTAQQQSNSVGPQKPTLYYIPHTHWEGAVFKTREEYLEMGLPHILQALALLRKFPNYRFTLDQVAYIRPFIERYPEHKAEFLKYVREGRLGIVGGMDVMPDDVKPGGELFVRQMQYGKAYCKEQLGVDVTTAWMLDTFGHNPQMPQILTQAGFTAFWFCRGVPNNNLPSEFRWKGIDGTEIPAFWLPGFYGLFWGPPGDEAGFNRFFAERYHALDPHALLSERVGLAGVDVSEPEPHVPSLVEKFNQNPQREFNIRTAVPADFERAVAKRKSEPVLTGDFNPIFQGTYSSRIELKQETREIEQELLTAEKLQSVAALFGMSSPSDLMPAWEPVLFNQTHDLASGVMTDHVYLDVQRGYDAARRMAAAETKSASEYLTARINTTGVGSPIVVFNPSGWSRTEAVEVNVGFTTTNAYDVRVSDARNLNVPCEIVDEQRNPNGSLLRATILFIAAKLPALGIATYHISPTIRRNASTAAGVATENVLLENEYYRVTVSRSTGAILNLYDKVLGWEALSGAANVISEQEDKGDLWELYHGLDGAQFIGMSNKQPVPTTETAHLSTQWAGNDGKVVHTPVYSEFTVSHPLGTGTFATRIRLSKGIPRVDIFTDIVNNDKLVRYQALFPTAVQNGRNTQEIQFGSVERPDGVEYPAQNWSDYSDTTHGVTLLNAGLPGNLASNGTLMVSLLRSHTIGGYGFGGGFEPGMTSESGYELNKPLHFRYSLVTHGSEWRSAAVRSGFAFNQPLQVWKCDVHPGIAPPNHSMVQISSPDVILTAFKPGPDNSTIIRVYEASGKSAKGVGVHINATVASAAESNLLEENGKSIAVIGDTVRFDLKPFEIKTIRLKLQVVLASALKPTL